MNTLQKKKLNASSVVNALAQQGGAYAHDSEIVRRLAEVLTHQLSCAQLRDLLTIAGKGSV